MAVIELNTANSLTLTQDAKSNIKWKAIRHRLRLASETKSNIAAESITDHIWFQQVATVRKSIIHLRVGNLLGLVNNADPRSLIEPTENHLLVYQLVSGINTKGANSEFELLDSVTFELVHYNLIDTLLLAQTVSFELIKGTIITQTLGFSHGVSVYKPSKNFIGPIE